MSEFDYISCFERTHEICLNDFGISMQPLYMNDILSFDKSKKKIYVNSKYLNSPNIISKAISNANQVLIEMLNLRTLKPYTHFTKLFEQLFPMYKFVTLNQIALATGPGNSILHFKKDSTSFDIPTYHFEKFTLHQSLKDFLIPVTYKKDAVKPYEYISERTLLQAKKVNDVLVALGHAEKCFFLSDKGLILETDVNDMYIVDADKIAPKKGDKTSKVYLEYKLLNDLLNA